MNCRDAESLILASRDTPPGAAEAEALERHLAECPDCRRLAANWEAARQTWVDQETRVPVPDATAEWHALRRRIRNADTPERGVHLAWSRLLRVTLPVAAAAAVVLGVSTRWAQPPEPWAEDAPTIAATSPTANDWGEFEDHFAFTASVEYVETEDSMASPFVYLDEESGWLVVWAADPPAPDTTSG